jgi:DNA-directed RNA polymerase specialized sigma24 family protein
LLAYACSFVSSFAAAEDIVHHVFERLLRGDLSITNAPVSYLYRAVRNASLNGIRDRAREADFDEGWLEAPSGMEHAALELQSALRELPLQLSSCFPIGHSATIPMAFQEGKR